MQEIKFTKNEASNNEPESVKQPKRENILTEDDAAIVDKKEYNDEAYAIKVKAYLKRGAGDFQKAFSKKTFYDFILGVNVFSIDKPVQVRAYAITKEGNLPIAIEENSENSVSIDKSKIQNGTVTVVIEIKYSLGFLKTKSYTLNLAMSV